MTFKAVIYLGCALSVGFKATEAKLKTMEAESYKQQLVAEKQVVIQPVLPAKSVRIDTVKVPVVKYLLAASKPCDPCIPCEMLKKQTVSITASGMPFFDSVSKENYLPITGDNKENISIADTNVLIPHHSKIKSK